MTKQDLIIRQISLNRFINERVVRQVVSHPILFARQRMADKDDNRPIRIKYFGTFVQKKIANKENVRKLNEILQLVRFNEEHYLKVFDGLFTEKEEILTHIRKAFNERNEEEFNEIYTIIVNNKCIQDK